jgi:hypothetical protein
MKKILPKFAGALLLAFAFGSVAVAVPITGSFTLAGDLQLAGTDGFEDATGVQSWHTVFVNNVQGDFSPMVATGSVIAIQAPYTFVSGPVDDFWSVGGFHFDLASSAVEFHDATSLAIKATGMVWGNGFDPTPGTWLFSTQSIAADGLFSFSASVGSGLASSVPDGGMTVLLLGAGLIGLTFVSRRRGLTGA